MTLQLDAEEGKKLARALAQENDMGPDEVLSSIAERVIETALDHLECPYEAEINLLLTGPEEVKNLNSRFRGIDQTTDVLSFPMLSFEQVGDFSFLEEEENDPCGQDCFNPETGELLLGDIVLNEERVLSQADAYGHSVTREYAFLIIHSVLHLCGYDHLTEEDEKTMRSRQEEILEKLGISR